jgi:hypothetical protein
MLQSALGLYPFSVVLIWVGLLGWFLCDCGLFAMHIFFQTVFCWFLGVGCVLLVVWLWIDGLFHIFCMVGHWICRVVVVGECWFGFWRMRLLAFFSLKH